MRLYSFQPIEVWEHLQKEQVLAADPSKGFYFDERWSFKEPYDWLREQYSRLRKNNEPSGYLWWAYPFKPDLRRYRYIYYNSIMLVIDVPDEEVLILDSDHWCLGSLNNGFVAVSCWESSWFDYYEAGLPFDLSPDATHEEIVDYENKNSYGIYWNYQDEWSDYCDQLREERKLEMFNPDFVVDPNWWGEVTQEAVFEFLRLEQVKKVVRFKGKNTRE